MEPCQPNVQSVWRLSRSREILGENDRGLRQRAIRESEGKPCPTGGKGEEETCSIAELTDEPDQHDAIAPAGHEHGTNDWFLSVPLPSLHCRTSSI
jgi:hypothetical protein